MLAILLGLTVHYAVNAWLTEKRYVMAGITHAMQKRIDTWRFATWQIYENVAAAPSGSVSNSLQETRLRPDVYYLEKNRRKTEALIFGSHDSSTLEMTQRISDYLDTLWGAENSTWSMYFLNGMDNSLMLVSTLPLKDMAERYKESAISTIVDARRSEMLQQANALDERESFSPLRRFAWQNDHYFTLRTTFNQPGHLATVLAFDLPVNDLIPRNMPLENFQLRQDTASPAQARSSGDEEIRNTRIALANPNLEVIATLSNAPLQLVYRVPLSSLVLDTLRNLSWPLISWLALLLLGCIGLLLLRRQSLRPSENQSAELDTLRLLNEEIVASLPVGLLVYDFATNRTLVSNKIAEHLLPHLNLQKIINLSDQHQGILQATVNNEVYEIRHSRSTVFPHTQLFVIRDQDRELLVNKKLQKAQQILDRSHQTRQLLLQNLGQALAQPVRELTRSLQAGGANDGQLEQAQSVARLVDDIVLLNQLETHDWVPAPGHFLLQEILNQQVRDILPLMRRKGLTLMVSSALPSDEPRLGDPRAVAKLIGSLLHYAITTTTWGKVSLTATANDAQPDRVQIEIIDTGAGLRREEIANSEFPFLGDTQADRYGQASGLTFFLCKQLCKQLGGQLDIYARDEIGTRYALSLPLPVEARAEREDEPLLADVTILMDITVDDVRKMVTQRLESWGAQCVSADERAVSQAPQYDLTVTDDPDRLTPWSLLVCDDEDGFRTISDNQYRVNFNLSDALQDAILALIEQQLSQDMLEAPQGDANSPTSLLAGGYFQLFVDTVPDDVKRLYTELASGDYPSLAQTAHRLKGVFAMLNLVPGKQLCETLELHINACDNVNIQSITSEIDIYVNQLMQQGNQ
ncbi:phosphotransferase RcsD [Pantoea sp. 1.19]|uniref:phosphotransferase RcsD n=1 Tax=Pantoea sp. 1.19 TaxID=1925589 RepID=UPI001F0A805C|nr:phosphotransferase RcsD [Pantoea sp. 1.19]